MHFAEGKKMMKDISINRKKNVVSAFPMPLM